MMFLLLLPLLALQGLFSMICTEISVCAKKDILSLDLLQLKQANREIKCAV